MCRCASILTSFVFFLALVTAPFALAQGVAPGYVATSPILPIVYAMPEGSWAKVNQNAFQSVWTPADLRPLTLGQISGPDKLISAWSGFATGCRSRYQRLVGIRRFPESSHFDNLHFAGP